MSCFYQIAGFQRKTNQHARLYLDSNEDHWAPDMVFRRLPKISKKHSLHTILSRHFR